jgi:hypothetical protein
MIKQQENIVPSDSAILVTLDEPLEGIMGFTKSSTKFYLGIALVFAECDGHLLHSQECISGYRADVSTEMCYFFFNLHGIKELAEVKWFSWLLTEFFAQSQQVSSNFLICGYQQVLARLRSKILAAI